MRTTRLVATTLVLAVLLAGCGDDGSEAADDAGTTSTTSSTTEADVADGGAAGDEPPVTDDGDATTTTAEEGGGGLCDAAERAATAFAPADASRASFEGIRDAWADLADELPPPHDATADALVAAYDEGLPLWGDDESSPSAEALSAITAGTSAELAGSFALADHVEQECGITLPGF